jgi:hypothetical protein
VPPPALNPAPRDLRPVAERPWQTFEEVAQAPAPASGHAIDMRVSSASLVGAIDRK